MNVLVKKEYNLKKLKKCIRSTKVDKDATRVPVSLCLDVADLVDIRTEAYLLGISYQTLITNILHRYVAGDLVERSSPE